MTDRCKSLYGVAGGYAPVVQCEMDAGHRGSHGSPHQGMTWVTLHAVGALDWAFVERPPTESLQEQAPAPENPAEPSCPAVRGNGSKCNLTAGHAGAHSTPFVGVEQWAELPSGPPRRT